MDPISNVDRIALLLRHRLSERAKAAGAASVSKTSTNRRDPTPIERAQALAAVEGIDDRQLRRALIQGLLGDQLGGELINEAKFQQVVDRVTETLEADAGSAKLLDRMVRELRAGGR